MSDLSPGHNDLFDEIHELVTARIHGELTSERLAHFDRLLASSEEARRLYIQYIYETLALPVLISDANAPSSSLAISSAMEDQAVAARTVPPGINLIGQPSPSGVQSDPSHVSIFSGAIAYVSSGWPMAYMASTVICGIGLLILASIPVYHHVQVTQKSIPLPSPSSSLHDPSPFVGRISGMVDCRFSNGSEVRGQRANRALRPSSLVSLGDTYALSSGLMEITYDTGAKVVLQGPCTYEVESKAGGYLSVGKLTARVEKKVESGEWRVESAKQQPADPSSPTPNPSLSTPHSPLFTIKTPTATVTDLGTEFGVEVDTRGQTTSHVFRGLVRVQALFADGTAEGAAQVLRENQSARVERNGHRRVIVHGRSAKPAAFVRKLVSPTNKTLDLVDVVAGGDGFSGRRNRGIDPTSGGLVDSLSVRYFVGDGNYHHVDEAPLIDGVFIPRPENATDPVPVDSAGHSVVGLPTNETQTLGYVWAGKEEGNCSVLADVDYASAGHGMIALHANKGITFDLEAIRRANPGWSLLRFRAVAGIAVPADANLIANGDFSAGVDGWVGDKSIDGVVADSSSPDSHNLLLRAPWKCHYQIPSAAIAEREQFNLSFMATSPTGTADDGPFRGLAVRLMWRWGDNSGDIGDPLTVSSADLRAGWATYTTSWTIPAGHDGACPQLCFEALNAEAGQQIAIDEVVFTHNQDGYADLRVFIDGNMRFQRREVNRHNGAMPVVVPIKQDDRFLTLVATDASNGIHGDHVIFGDPRIEMASAGKIIRYESTMQRRDGSLFCVSNRGTVPLAALVPPRVFPYFDFGSDNLRASVGSWQSPLPQLSVERCMP